MDLKARAKKVFRILKKAYPEARCMLDHENAFQLVVATILAAQCTDAKVNEVAAALFGKYSRPKDIADADMNTLRSEIRPTGFYNQKAKLLKGCCEVIVEKHGGEVPGTMAELTALPGVGRKTANVVLGECFDEPGIIVDTHFKRVTNRLGLTKEDNPDKIESDLDALIPKKDRTLFSHLITFHGRRTCIARKPKCEECVVNDLCDCRAKNK